jgi:predicted SprT family Zn-dependent metalloprotease
MVFRHKVAPDVVDEVSVNVMYFDPQFVRQASNDALVKTVAHESAHLVLGH